MTEANRVLSVRAMAAHEVALAIEWAAQEGWNPGLHDASCFLAADAQGFLVGELAGEPVSCISAVRYGADFGFLGFYLVRPEERGRGYGLATWEAALARLQGRVIGLDGVLAQEASYRRSGFVTAYHNIRFGGRPAGASGHAQPAAEVPFEELAEFDAEHFGYRRAGFLRAWLAQEGATALALQGEDGLTGYGVVRRCRSGHKIGPLFARGPAAARELAAALAAEREGEVFLDVPEPNQAALDLARELGLAPVFETVRMYRGEPPRLPLAQIYGVTTFELG